MHNDIIYLCLYLVETSLHRKVNLDIKYSALSTAEGNVHLYLEFNISRELIIKVYITAVFLRSAFPYRTINLHTE